MLPLTYFSAIGELTDEKYRRMMLSEQAANGVRHLVLTDVLIAQICRTPTLLRTVAGELSDYGLDLVDAHAPFTEYGNLAIPDAGNRQFMLDRQRLVLRIVHELGVKTCTFHVGRLYWADYTLEQYRSAVRASLDELLPVAASLDVTMAIENIMRPLNTTDFLVELMRDYRSDHLGICYDIGHANIMETGREQAGSQPYGNWDGWGDIQWETNVLESVLPYVVNCHLHDNTGFHDDHKMPGEGTVRWEQVLGLLRRAPRLQNIQSEVMPMKYGYSIKRLAETMSSLLTKSEFELA